MWKNSRKIESVICQVVWCCRPPTLKKKFFGSMAFAMDISMGYPMHTILTFSSMGFAMLTSMGFAMPSWHSWCTMYTEHFSSLDLSTVSKWLHHRCSHPQSHKNPVSASAMLTGKFLQIRKVLQQAHYLLENLRIFWKMSGYYTKYPDNMQSVWMSWKISGWSKKCRDELEIFQMIWKVSGWTGKFLDNLKNVSG